MPGEPDTIEERAMFRTLIAAALLVSQPLTAQASRFVHLEVDRQADAYYIHAETAFDAPTGRVRAILTDYDNLEQLNPSITASRIIAARDDGVQRVLTRFEHCVLVFCGNLQKVEDISEDEQGRIRMVMVPDASSFRSGVALWDIRRDGRGSRVILHACVEPDTLLPNWLGTGIIKRTLYREIRVSFENLEALVRDTAGARRTPARDTNHSAGRTRLSAWQP